MVLVILAILAAILVPALLGWIDKAREKQYVLDARSVYMATQAYVDEQYAKGTSVATGTLPSDVVTEIEKIADVSCGDITIGAYKARQDATKDQGEIASMVITGLGGTANMTATLNGGSSPANTTGWVITKGTASS